MESIEDAGATRNSTHRPVPLVQIRLVLQQILTEFSPSSSSSRVSRCTKLDDVVSKYLSVCAGHVQRDAQQLGCVWLYSCMDCN